VSIGSVLLGGPPAPARAGASSWCIEVADADGVAAHRALRREVFVAEQGLFGARAAEEDALDHDPRTVVLVAREPSPDGAAGGASTARGRVLGGVRLAPAGQHLTGGVDVGWWAGSRLAVARGARASRIGPALVRAACARAEAAGALRFDATVQAAAEPMFRRLGWERVRDAEVPGAEDVPHVLVRWPIDRTAALLEATKAPLGGLLAGLLAGGAHLGDDSAPVPGSDLVAACDAVVPSMVERDPEWAGWCAALVNVNDVAAMGAVPVGLLDAVGARDASFAARVLSGLRAACEAYGVPLLGGHTQLGVPAALSATALGRVPAGLEPVPGGGGRPGPAVSARLRRTAVGLHHRAHPRRAPRPDWRRGADPARGRQGRLDGRRGGHPRDAGRGQRHRGGARRRGRAASGVRTGGRLADLLPRHRVPPHRRPRARPVRRGPRAAGRRRLPPRAVRRAHRAPRLGRYPRRAPALARRRDHPRHHPRRPRDRPRARHPSSSPLEVNP